MKGILYGVGVGPGDPELLTAKAIRLLRECDAIAAPKSADGRQTALDIASPYIGQDKTILLLDMPMTHDRQARNASHDAAADALCALLDEGKTVVFLTLGDPTIYSTYWYVHKLSLIHICPGPVLHAITVEPAEKAKEDIVYFN